MTRRFGQPVALMVVIVSLAYCASPPPAAALNPIKPICSLAGLVSTLAGKVCSAAGHPGRLLSAGKQLLRGHLGGALGTVLGDGAGTVTKAAAATAGIAAIVAWVGGGAKFVLHETAAVISSTSRPELQSTWFSASYWRMAGVSALLTLPFLFAAALQALIRSDLGLLARAAFGYLPLGLLAVGVAAPVTMLLLAASDEMSAIVTSASGGADSGFLAHAGALAGGAGLVARSPFLVFLIGLVTVAAAVTLWIELLIRSAAVYVIVLMLPLFFAAMVWPARRVWAVRAIELLIALILSKFAIVAVLALGGAALGHTTVPSATQMLAGTTLVLLAAFSPWALLRLLPLHELASSAAGGLRGAPIQRLMVATAGAEGATTSAQELAWELPGRMLRESAPDPSGGARPETERLSLVGSTEGVQPGATGAPGAGGGPSAGGGPDPGGGPPVAPGPGATDGPAPAFAAESGAAAGLSSPAEPPSTAEPGNAPETPGQQRRPGMDAPWQMPNNSWPTLDLERTDGGNELHDPLPPPEEPEGGPL